MTSRTRHVAFWTAVLSEAGKTEEHPGLRRMAALLSQSRPELLLLGHLPESIQVELNQLSRAVMPYLQDSPLPVSAEAVREVASALRTTRVLLQDNLAKRSTEGVASACVMAAYWHFTAPDLLEQPGEPAVAQWLRARLTALLRSFVAQAEDTLHDMNADVGLLNASTLPDNPAGYARLARLLSAFSDYVYHGPAQTAWLLLRRMDIEEYHALAATVRSPAQALLLQASLSAGDAVSLALAVSPRSPCVLFEAVRRATPRRTDDAASARPADLTQCLLDLAALDINAILGIQSVRRVSGEFSYALGLAMTRMLPDVVDALTEALDVTEYTHAYDENKLILAGLDKGNKPEVTQRVCTRVLRRYEQLAIELWGMTDHALLTPLVTGAMPFIVRALSAELSGENLLADRISRALDRISLAETEWASSSVQQRCRFLVALGELCLIGAAAAANYLSFSDSLCAERLAGFLGDPRKRMWFMSVPVEAGRLLEPLHSLIGRPSADFLG